MTFPEFPVAAELERSRSIVLERLYVHFHKIIPDLQLSRNQMEFATRLDQGVVGVVAQLRGWLLNGHKQDRIETDIIEFPTSPWQFFKERYAPKWWLRRWPVICSNRPIRVAVHHHYVCPHVAVDNNDPHGHTIHYLWMGEMSGQLPGGSVKDWQARQREQETY